MKLWDCDSTMVCSSEIVNGENSVHMFTVLALAYICTGECTSSKHI